MRVGCYRRWSMAAYAVFRVRVIIDPARRPRQGNPVTSGAGGSRGGGPGARSARIGWSVFRRRDAGAGGAVEEAAEAGSGTADSAASRGGAAVTPGKGRPTPKRSEAERRRRQPYSGAAATRRPPTAVAHPGPRRPGAQVRGDEARRGMGPGGRDKGPIKALDP